MSDVKRFLSRNINTVRRLTAKRILNAYRINLSGNMRFREEDIVNFLMGQSEKGERPNHILSSSTFTQRL